MRFVRLLSVSVAPSVAWVLATGCGSGGGYRGAYYESAGGTQSGAGAGGVGAGAGGVGAGAGGAGAGAGGLGAEGGLSAGSGGALFAGQAGSAGTDAGFAGVGGISGAAGAGGFAGDGNSGASGGGVAATGGAAGSAAAAGGVGGLGATAGVLVGGGGAGGASSGGTAGSGFRVCAERCNGDADCRVFSIDFGHRCNTSTHRCERFAEPCRSSVECIPDASAWLFSCTDDDDCFFFTDDVCVNVGGGVGRCARLPPSGGCVEPTTDEVTLPRLGASGNATVCANTSRTCLEGKCLAGCATDAECSPERNGSVCDTQARLCRCVRDQDCGGAGVSRCNTATGRCECSSDQDCTEIPNSNVCSSGRCGCSAVSACNAERAFSGTTYVCE